MKVLGHNFSARFRDLDDHRFWRATMPGVETGRYGALGDLARNRVNLNKVIPHWPDMLKAASSPVTDQVRAYGLLRMFGRERCPTPLGTRSAGQGCPHHRPTPHRSRHGPMSRTHQQAASLRHPKSWPKPTCA
ncbi:Tn3 family transposase [Streptomyces sp. SP18CS02]|nr:Tn3 family transposase [Streptomyces sp. SP18CS02]MEE1751980.1 Tn3 family transposase [Streptomyces sp. SP18CS02]